MENSKLISAAAAILDEIESKQLNIVVLNKALFYLDLYALRDLGETVTGAQFVALKNGPVVASYKTRLVAALRDHGVAEQYLEYSGYGKPVKLIDSDKAEPLKNSEHRLVRDIAASFSGTTSAMAVDYSHHNPGWIAAKRKGVGTPINMLLAMQQLAHDDPWLDEELTEEEEAELALAVNGPTEAL